MDCVTCLLMGVCVLCGHNFGAANPGRPMTKAEVDSALQTAFRHINTVNTNNNVNSYHRQSKLDPRFGAMGIGKRRGPKIDPYNFSAGLGKRNFEESSDVEKDLYQPFEELMPLNYATGYTSDLSENAVDSNTISSLKTPSSRPYSSPFLYKYMKERPNSVAKSIDFLEEEINKLQERRQRHRQDPFLTMAGVRR